MVAHIQRIAATLVTSLLLSFALVGCDDDDDTPVDQQESSWTYESDTAPYALEVPAGWQQQPVEKLNRSADLALNYEKRYYLIVIPQELPSFEGIASPDALALQRASIHLLEERIDEFVVEKEGPVELDDESALSVLASGKDGEQPVQYINTYATHDNWGYQIVAWGRQDDKQGLIDATDELLEGWRFTGGDEAAQTGGTPAADEDEPDPK